MKSVDFVSKLKKLATDYNTLYVMGCFGAPLTGKNVERYCNNHSYNRDSKRTDLIKSVADKKPCTYGFDCVCLIKAVLWGWNGNSNETYGGAVYKSNDVPDIGADSIINKCNEVSTDFTNIVDGALVWIKGHVGIYVGNGEVVECTPKWDNKVQISKLENLGYKGSKSRTWTKWGKLPYLEYEEKKEDLDVSLTDVIKAMEKLGFKIKTQTDKEVSFYKGTDTNSIKVGDIIKLKAGATYYNGKSIPSWLFKSTIYYRGSNKNGVIISTLKSGAITGVVKPEMII